MTTTRRMDKLLDKPWRSLSDREWRRVERWFPDEFAYVMVQLKPRPDRVMTTELEELGRRLNRLYPYSPDYYRVRAETARNRPEMDERLAASVPFNISAGARR